MNNKKTVPVILGTDWWTDCDDIVAMRVLAWAQAHGLVKIKGICINACMKYSAPSLDAYMHSEGLCNIPIGIDLNATDYDGVGVYQEWLASHPHRYGRNENYMEAVPLYRKALCESEEKVDILEIGFGQVLAGLLNSNPDSYSPLNGYDLIKQKVNKLWMMAGKWDEPNGKEYNFINGEKTRRAGNLICGNWPTPITFLGFEIGFTVITGDTLTSDKDMLKAAMCHAYSPNGRYSWDPMLVLMACINDEHKAGYEVVRGTASVDPETGSNHFVPNPNGKHGYVKKAKPDIFYKNMINGILKEREQF